MERGAGILTKYFREGGSRYQDRWQYVNDCTLVTPYRLVRGGVNDVSLSAHCTKRKAYMAFTVYPMMRGPRVSVGACPLAPDIGDKRLAIWWSHSRGHRLPAVARREAKGRSFGVDPVARGYEALIEQERGFSPLESRYFVVACCRRRTQRFPFGASAGISERPTVYQIPNRPPIAAHSAFWVW